MTIFELPIKETYVPEWSTWECIRESIQNGLDQGDRGFALKVEYKDGWLSVYNHGADMQVKALLLGETDKADDKAQRGQYGEGLDLSFLAGLRAGYEIQVFTQAELWVPSIKFSDKYGANVLMVQTRKLRTKRAGVEVRIKMPIEDWEGFKRLFVDLRDLDEAELVRTDKGTILFDKESKGMIYVKGIFVEKRTDFRYGYDLAHAELDRDRRVVGDFHLKWEISEMYSEAAHRCPDIVKDKVYVMLKAGTPDVEGFCNYTTSDELREQVAAQFLTDHGKEAVPVQSIGESAEMEHYGRQGVVVNDSMKKMLEQSKAVETPFDLKRKMRGAVKEKFSWQDLSDDERKTLKETCDLLENAFTLIRDDVATCKLLGISSLWTRISWKILDRVNIVEFRDAAIKGQAKPDTGDVLVAKDQLRNSVSLLRTLIHEIPHVVLKCHDGSGAHNIGIEELWTLIYFSK